MRSVGRSKPFFIAEGSRRTALSEVEHMVVVIVVVVVVVVVVIVLDQTVFCSKFGLFTILHYV